MKIELFYDKQCPFCKSYANYIKLNQNHELILLDARENLNDMEIFRKNGFHINDGFIIRIDDFKLYQGADAIIFLNKIANKNVYFPNNRFFKDFVYPAIKLIRKLLLTIMGKDLDIMSKSKKK